MKVVYDIESYDNTGVFYTPYIPKMQLIVSDGRVHGAKYYTVAPVFGNWSELEAWAKATYGEPGSMWDALCQRWYMNNGKFWFRKKADLEWFMLRWA